jgi:hypothetical protein
VQLFPTSEKGQSATPSFAVGTAGVGPIAATPGGSRGGRDERLIRPPPSKRAIKPFIYRGLFVSPRRSVGASIPDPQCDSGQIGCLTSRNMILRDVGYGLGPPYRLPPGDVAIFEGGLRHLIRLVVPLELSDSAKSVAYTG